ncbi:DUF4335 domain-containing protein [Geminocystis sp. NIES-3709]|uniref:DUF4335 domain-containing protein n=1 Tax=Geminocystis sp. NIES-3709 TaxID=1617448 RepID=UPI0005FC597C|nr:DUF4335 domain-containing protein [Geminocystis sp. NIES-3709]BAQ63649.1 hypothetical protein GM3709_414 [Geminocystis sp. NIES-3709]
MSNTIHRQYISPNCVLSLQGFSDDNNDVMSVLTQAECQIVGHTTILSGGLVFVENLIKAVSAYSQELLSGLSHSGQSTDDQYICLRKLPEKNRHLLIWQEKKEDTNNQLEIELSTIQFFDLLDTIDQLSVDKYTLPQLEDNLYPLSRRYRQGDISIVEQSTPLALGFVGLALASIALFMIPNPSTIKDPNQEPKPIPNNNTQVIPPSQTPNGN